MRAKYRHVSFFGQDDKAKIPLGNSVALSTGVRRIKSAIVPAEGGEEVLRAADHDFRMANITPSVTLHCNIPRDMSGSFFSCGEDGFGQIFVTLRDSVFDASRVMDHCAQLVHTIESSDFNPAVVLYQTDSGVDHALSRAQTKLALIGEYIQFL